MRDGSKVVVREHHLRRLLGGLGALDPHGNAHVRSFQRRGIVHAVAGHGTNLTPRLEGMHQAELVLGTRAGKHIDRMHLIAELRVAVAVQMFAGERCLAVADGHLPRDRARCTDVIAGDHLDANAGPLALANRANGVLAGWIDKTDDTEQRQSAVDIGKPQLALLGGGRLEGNGQRSLAQRADAVQLFVPIVQVQRLIFAEEPLVTAALQHDLRGAFHVDESVPRVVVVQRGHELVLGFERNHIGAGKLFLQERVVKAVLQPQRDQCALGGIAFHAPAAFVLR